MSDLMDPLKKAVPKSWVCSFCDVCHELRPVKKVGGRWLCKKDSAAKVERDAAMLAQRAASPKPGEAA